MAKLTSSQDLPSMPASGNNHDSQFFEIRWLSSKEAAAYLRVSAKSLLNETSNGKIPFYKFGKRNRYRLDELNELLLAHKRGVRKWE